MNGFLDRFAAHGAIGVEIFFVISGYLITTLMLRELDRHNTIDVKAFYIRRILRIVPAYVAYICTILVLHVSGQIELERRDWLAVSTYTVNFLYRPTWEIGHIWSLSIEEHFYLIWPLVVAFGGRRFAVKASMALVIGAFATRWIVLLAYPRMTQMAELWTFTRLDTIAWGGLLALLTCERGWSSRLDTLFVSSRAVIALALGLIGSLMLSSVSAKYSVGMAYTVNAMIITSLLWASVRSPDSTAGKMLNFAPVRMIGVASYSLYLWQQVFLSPGRSAGLNRFPLNIVFACAAAVASYMLVERPFLRIKARLGTVGNRVTDARPRPITAQL